MNGYEYDMSMRQSEGLVPKCFCVKMLWPRTAEHGFDALCYCGTIIHGGLSMLHLSPSCVCLMSKMVGKPRQVDVAVH